MNQPINPDRGRVIVRRNFTDDAVRRLGPEFRGYGEELFRPTPEFGRQVDRAQCGARLADAFGACRRSETIVNRVYNLDRGFECLSS